MKVVSDGLKRDEWDLFLKMQNYAHFWHTWQWGEFLKLKPKRKMLRLAVKEEEQILGLYQICVQPVWRYGLIAESIPVHHFCGPVVNDNIDHIKREHVHRMLARESTELLRNLGAISVSTSIWDPLLDRGICDVWLLEGYEIKKGESFIYRMPQNNGEVDEKYRFKFAGSVKQGMKRGCVIKRNPPVSEMDIYRLYLLSMRNAQLEPRYSYEEIKCVLNWDSRERDVFVAEDNSGRIAGFAIYLKFNKTAIYWLSGMDRNYKRVNPMNVITDAFLKVACEDNIRTVDFGGGGNEGLTHFKKSIGADAEPVFTFSRILLKKKYVFFKTANMIRKGIARG